LPPRTLLDKIWDDHVVVHESGKPDLLYIDLHLVHEVTSPQAFDGLRMAGRKVHRPDLTLATADHNVPTKDRHLPIADPISKRQLDVIDKNCKEFGIELYGINHARQGIVHVIGPELGLTLPGKTVVCGDSHTATHGALGALAFGIGTSEVEHVLATQCLWQDRPKSMLVEVSGRLGPGVSAKDLVLYIIGRIGTDGGTGYAIEYAGEAVRALSMDGRMTLCNMTIEAGARSGMIAPDDTTFEYIAGRPFAPKGNDWDEALAYWRSLPTDPDARFDRVVRIDGADVAPQVTWGTNPGHVLPVTSVVPDPTSFPTEADRRSAERALQYMGLRPGMPLESIAIDCVFVGACTNGRIEDLRAAAAVAKGRKVAPGVRALVVPGSAEVKRQAEAEGLHRIFLEAGFEWREAGCSMCLGMNPDTLAPGERSASTSNRNFEGRQGKDSRTHLVSPAMAAAAAVTGHLTDVRKLMGS